jgi:hypothetical protein
MHTIDRALAKQEKHWSALGAKGNDKVVTTKGTLLGDRTLAVQDGAKLTRNQKAEAGVKLQDFQQFLTARFGADIAGRLAPLTSTATTDNIAVLKSRDIQTSLAQARVLEQLAGVPTPTWGGGPLPLNATEQQRVASEMHALYTDVINLLVNHERNGRAPNDPGVRQEVADLLNARTYDCYNDKGMAQLPLQDQAMILSLIRELDLAELVTPQNSEVTKAVANLQRQHAPLASEFGYTDQTSDYSQKKAQLFAQIKNDPDVQALFAAASTGTVARKDLERVAYEIVVKQAQVFGFTLPPGGIQFFVRGEQDAPNRGNYESGTRQLKLNVTELGSEKNGLAEILNAVAHENLHNWQHQLIDQLSAGQIDKNKNSDLYHTASIFDFNWKEPYQLNTTNYGDDYKYTALERVAHDIGLTLKAELRQAFGQQGAVKIVP